MMDRQERSALTAALCNVVRDYVTKAEEKISKWVTGELKALTELFEERINALPTPKNGKDADLKEVRKFFEDNYSHIPTAKDWNDVLVRMIEALPKPKDGEPGKNAEPIDMIEVERLIEFHLRQYLEALPKPRDGKDADLEKIEELVADSVQRAVAAIPPAERGKDADPVDMAEVGRLIELHSKLYVEALPKPRDGKDADLDEVKRLIVDAVASIPPGPPGKPGKDGESVHPDTIALMISKEVRTAIAELPRPKDGLNGVQIETVPFYAEKSYPRGACIAFAGGTFRAFRETTPGEPRAERGWEVLLNGYMLPLITISEDCRDIKILSRMSDGQSNEIVFHVPTIQFRGQYVAGQTYFRGDSVVQGYSTWHCNAESTTVPPSTPGTKDWQIMAKRGADGKDLRSEQPKEFKPVVLK